MRDGRPLEPGVNLFYLGEGRTSRLTMAERSQGLSIAGLVTSSIGTGISTFYIIYILTLVFLNSPISFLQMLPLFAGATSIVGLILGLVAVKQDGTNVKAKVAAGIGIAGTSLFALLVVVFVVMLFR